MKNQMNKNTRVWLMLITIIVVTLLTTLWITIYRPTASPFDPRRWPTHNIRGDIELYYTIKTLVSTINATLLVFLLATYINIYSETKSDFTIGLVVFSLVLLLYALVSNPIIHWIFGFRGVGLGPFAVLPDLFTCAALAVLLYLTLKY